VAAELVFGRVPHPPFEDRYIPDYQTSAWNDLGQRNPVGTCRHSMIGSLAGTDKWFRNGVPSAAHRATGLTDYGIGGSTDGSLDGVIWRWNDPRGRRAGWASGGSDGLEGDGIAFVRTLGVNAINRDLVSIERSDGGKIETPPSAKQLDSLIALEAYWFDQAGVPWDTFPKNPNVGIVTDMEHWEFATKACPFDPMRRMTTEIQQEIRDVLKSHQVVIEPAEPTDPVPEQPEWPNGWTTDELKAWFGQVLEVDFRKPEKGFTPRTFNKDGVISNMWVQRAVAEGITQIKRIPKPGYIAITAAKDGTPCHSFIVPRSGYPDWVAFRGDGNDSWKWFQ